MFLCIDIYNCFVGEESREKSGANVANRGPVIRRDVASVKRCTLRRDSDDDE